MTKNELKEQINAILDAATIETENVTPQEYFKRHFLTINEAILYADDQGVKLTNNPVHQFYNMCKTGKLENIPVGEKNTRLIIKESLDAWIQTKKAKSGNV